MIEKFLIEIFGERLLTIVGFPCVLGSTLVTIFYLINRIDRRNDKK